MSEVPVILSVCIRCRSTDWRGEDKARPGARLAAQCNHALSRADLPADVVFRSIHCMSQCKRPCVAAFSGIGRFTWLFGDLEPDREAPIIIEALRLYISRPDGFMERHERPAALQAGVLGRIPPPDCSGAPVEAIHKFPADRFSEDRHSCAHS